MTYQLLVKVSDRWIVVDTFDSYVEADACRREHLSGRVTRIISKV